jgi:hypothetical protein
MTLPALLIQAYRRRRLLILWASLPFPLLAQPPANRALVLNQWSAQARTQPLPPELVKGLVRLPPLPFLSLEPGDRLEQALASVAVAFHVVRTRQEVPIPGRHTLIKLAGDLPTRSGVILSRAQLHHLGSDPDKRHLLAEASRLVEEGAVLALAANPANEDFQAWWAVLQPVLGQLPLFALGDPAGDWPAGTTLLTVELADLAAALAAITPESVDDRSPLAEPPDWDQFIAQLNTRLDDLSGQLKQGVADLKDGQVALYRQVGPAQREELAQVLAAAQQGRLAQAEMQATLADLRRAMQIILNQGSPMPPELRTAIADLTEAVESSLSLDQKLELALPLVPLLLNYKIELGAGSDLDLHDLVQALQQRWQRLRQMIGS